MTISDKNYVNVYFETNPLEHGHRYVICIHADAVLLEHEYWKEPLPEISSCSDGITVDITPPRPGDIWIYNKDALYQVGPHTYSCPKIMEKQKMKYFIVKHKVVKT